MNRYEAVILDRMVEIRNDSVSTLATEKIILLLDCICDFREPPRSLDVADGYGALAVVDAEGEVVE